MLTGQLLDVVDPFLVEPATEGQKFESVGGQGVRASTLAMKPAQVVGRDRAKPRRTGKSFFGSHEIGSSLAASRPVAESPRPAPSRRSLRARDPSTRSSRGTSNQI